MAPMAPGGVDVPDILKDCGIEDLRKSKENMEKMMKMEKVMMIQPENRDATTIIIIYLD